MLTRRLLHATPHLRTTSYFAKCPALVFAAAQSGPWASWQSRNFHQTAFLRAEDNPKNAAPLAGKNAVPLPVGSAEAMNMKKVMGTDVSNKEQRKADWAIIKEMGRYIWPKV
jgi:hypothetical protein